MADLRCWTLRALDEIQPRFPPRLEVYNQRSSQTIDIFKIKIESERISSWDEPAFLGPRQVQMSACTVR
jgi:hypothetical protein